MLSEINIAPRILTNFTGVMPPQFKKDLDSYLKTRSPVTFLSDLRSNLQVNWFDLICSLFFVCTVHCVSHLETLLNLAVHTCFLGTKADRSRVCGQPELHWQDFTPKIHPSLYTHQNIVRPVHWVTLTGFYTLLIFYH